MKKILFGKILVKEVLLALSLLKSSTHDWLIFVIATSKCLWHGSQQQQKFHHKLLSYKKNSLSSCQEPAEAGDIWQTNERIINVFERIADGFVALDREWRYTYVNHKAEELLGTPRADLIGKNIWEIAAKSDLQHYSQFHQALAQQVTFEYEEFYPRINRWFLVRLYPSDDGISVYFQDITERKRSEERLRLSEQRFSVAIHNSPIIVFNQDRELRYTWIYNPKLGYSLEKVLGRTDADIMHPDDAAYLTEIKQRVLETGIGIREEVRGSFNGERSYFDLTVEPLRDAAGNIIGITGAAMDITERNLVETNLKKTHQMLDGLIQASPIAILVFDVQYIVRLWNPAAERMFGWSAIEIIGKPLPVIPKEKQEEFRSKVKSIIQGQAIANFETYRQRKDGSLVEVSISTAPLYDAKGEVWAVMAIIADITERKRLEVELTKKAEELTTANRIKDEFLAIASHELRTPLSAMLGWAQTLQRNKLTEAVTHKGLATIERSAKLQVKLIDDILDVSRIIQGKLHLNPSSVDLVEVIEAAIEVLNPIAQAKSIKLKFVKTPSVIQIWGDWERLQQIVWNLVSNAIKFTPEGGLVEVQLDCMGSYVEMRVTDTGIGISSDFLPYVFETFRQADSTTTRASGGLGLGLAIVLHLVKLHNGKIYAASNGEGKGAVFTVQLPILAVSTKLKNQDWQRVQSSDKDILDNPLSLNGLRILLVDDDVALCELLSFVLELYAAKVTAVASAQEAVETLEHWHPDILVSDLAMPGEDGYSLLSKLRKIELEKGKERQIPAVALTAFTKEEERKRALSAGFQIYVTKPVEPTELVKVVANLAKRI